MKDKDDGRDPLASLEVPVVDDGPLSEETPTEETIAVELTVDDKLPGAVEEGLWLTDWAEIVKSGATELVPIGYVDDLEPDDGPDTEPATGAVAVVAVVRLDAARVTEPDA